MWKWWVAGIVMLGGQAVSAQVLTAADVIRRAMIRMPGAIKDLPAKMLLQVHDELLFEVADDAVDQTIDVARRIMENASDPVVRLDVPLIVDAGQGANWAEAH